MNARKILGAAVAAAAVAAAGELAHPMCGPGIQLFEFFYLQRRRVRQKGATSPIRYSKGFVAPNGAPTHCRSQR